MYYVQYTEPEPVSSNWFLSIIIFTLPKYLSTSFGTNVTQNVQISLYCTSNRNLWLGLDWDDPGFSVDPGTRSRDEFSAEAAVWSVESSSFSPESIKWKKNKLKQYAGKKFTKHNKKNFPLMNDEKKSSKKKMRKAALKSLHNRKCIQYFEIKLRFFFQKYFWACNTVIKVFFGLIFSGVYTFHRETDLLGKTCEKRPRFKFSLLFLCQKINFLTFIC